MPTYEYACRSCGQHLEVVQSFKDDALTDCPHCHGELRKVFSAAGIIFKGSGWHVKDYAGTAKGGAAAASSSKDGDGAPEDRSSTDGASSKDGTSGSSGDGTSSASSATGSSSSSTSSSGADAKSA